MAATPRCNAVSSFTELAGSTTDCCFFASVFPEVVIAKLCLGRLRNDLGGKGLESSLGLVASQCGLAKLSYTLNSPAFDTVYVVLEGSHIVVERAVDALTWLHTAGAVQFQKQTLLTMLAQRIQAQLRLVYNVWLFDPRAYHEDLNGGRTMLPAVPASSEISPAYTPKHSLRHTDSAHLKYSMGSTMLNLSPGSIGEDGPLTSPISSLSSTPDSTDDEAAIVVPESKVVTHKRQKVFGVPRFVMPAWASQ